LSITYMRAFKVGDRVRIGDTVGDVIDQTLLVTHVRTIKNEDITVPNSMVLNAHIVNYSARAKEEGLILHTAVTIGYDAPWRTVHELLIEAARKTPYILTEPKPFVLQTALNDFYVTYELNAHTDDPQQMVNTYSALHRNIQDTFNEAGVEIMSPHYTQLRDGNKTAIPDSYLPPEYVPGSLRVASVPDRPRKRAEGDPGAGARTEGGGTPEPSGG
jgi:small-conductance mechanosensitive channel